MYENLVSRLLTIIEENLNDLSSKSSLKPFLKPLFARKFVASLFAKNIDQIIKKISGCSLSTLVIKFFWSMSKCSHFKVAEVSNFVLLSRVTNQNRLKLKSAQNLFFF